jgi:hypothetical protein
MFRFVKNRGTGKSERCLTYPRRWMQMSDEGFHPIGRWKGEGSGFIAETIRRHKAERYWSSYYSPPAYATPTMYAYSPYYSPYGYGGGYPAYRYYGGYPAYSYGGGYPQFYGYYGQTYPQYTYPLTYGYWRPVIPCWGY